MKRARIGARTGHRRQKETSGLGKGVFLHCHAEAAANLEAAIAKVDRRRPVATRGMKTAVAVDTGASRWYSPIDRIAFYRAACRAMRKAVQGCKSDRERRKAEREGVLSVLEDFALISRTRGGPPL